MGFEDFLNPELFEQMEKQLEDPLFQLLMKLNEIIIEYDSQCRILQKRFVSQFESAISEFSQSRNSNS